MSEGEFIEVIKVESYSGYKANERPISFFFGGQKLSIVDIIDRWYGMEHDYFKVIADDGRVYLLRWQRLSDYWSLVKVAERQGKH